MNNCVRKYLVLIKKTKNKKIKACGHKNWRTSKAYFSKNNKKTSNNRAYMRPQAEVLFIVVNALYQILDQFGTNSVTLATWFDPNDNKCSEFAPALIHPWGSWVLWFSEPFAVPYWQREQDFSGTKLKRIKPMVVTQTSCGSFIQRLLFRKKTSIWRWGTLRSSLRENFS